MTTQQQPVVGTDARPLFFPSPGGALFGWLHAPTSGEARGGVVLCPPLFVERLSAHASLRQLAASLAERGLLALCYDYPSTGDSAGSESEPGQLAAWRASVHSAVELLRRHGARQVALVGLRMGALFAALAAAEDPDLEALVLWDPCAGGRAFLREQQALRAVSIDTVDPAAARRARIGPPGGDGAVEVLGALVPPELAAALSALELASVPAPRPRQLLAVLRAERPPPARLAEALAGWGAELVSVRGQSELVDALPDSSQVQPETLATIADWLGAALAGSPALVPVLEEETAGPVEVGRGVLERARLLGPLGLFALESMPAGRSLGPTVVFLNAGLIDHTGPSRLWVGLSRALAEGGMRSLRLDLSGLGDSPVRPGQRRQVVYPLEGLEDIEEVVRQLEAENPEGVVLTGLCSGAYHAIEGGIAFPVRAVVPINPFLNFDPEEVRSGGELASSRSAVTPYDGWIRLLLRYRRLVDFGDRHVPPALWWLLERLGLHHSPARGLERLAERGVKVQLICCELEARQFTRRARWTMRRLQRSGLVRLHVLPPGADHTLFGAAARQLASEAFLDFVLAGFGPGAAPVYEAAAPTLPSFSARWEGTTS